MTCGKGTMLPNIAASQALQWYAPGDVPATEEQISADWVRVAAINSGYLAKRYFSPEGLYLMPSEIDMQAEKAIMAVDADLTGELPYYASLPDSVQLALIDLGYSLGVHRLLAEFPKLMAAVKARNWPLAAAESKRPQLSITRNEWTAAQIRMAK